MPQTWYVVLRLGQGFAAGVVVGVLWALWIIRRRRTAGTLVEPAARLPGQPPEPSHPQAPGRSPGGSQVSGGGAAAPSG